jgi:hypothetical protein
MLLSGGWSLYEAPWLQLLATNGKSDGRGSPENKLCSLAAWSSSSDARLRMRGGGGMTRKQAGGFRPCLLLDLSPAVASLDWPVT